VVGDSITLESVVGDYTGVVYGDDGLTYYTAGEGSSVFVSGTDKSWFCFADAFMGAPHRLIRNAAVGGNTTTQILARVNADVLDHRPSIIYDLSGTNDIVGSASAATIIANKTALFDLYESIGAYVCAIGIMPRQIFTAGQLTVAVTVNKWLQGEAARRKNFRFVSIFAQLADPLTGAPLSGVTYDGTHPNNLGSYIIGEAVARVMAPVLPQWDYTPEGSAAAFLVDNTADIRNDNPLMAQGSGGTLGAGVSGTIAQGFDCGRISGSATVVASIEPHPRRMGYRQKLVITFTASGESVYFGTPNLSARYLAGKVLEGQCDIEVAAGSATVISRTTLSCGATVTGGVTKTARALDQTAGSSPGSIPYGTAGFVARLRTPRLQMQSTGSCSTWNNRLNLYSNGAGTVTVYISLFAARMITTP